MSKIDITKKDLPKSMVEITATLPYEMVIVHEASALERIAKELEVDGFRKGNVPITVARQHIKEMQLIEAMAEEALMKAYGDIISEHNIQAIGRPDIVITKIGKDNPLEFKITASVIPTVILPDYKKIAKEENKNKTDLKVEDKDIEEALKDLQTMRARKEHNETHHHEGIENHEEHNHDDLPLPELNDAFAQSFGEQFKTLEDLKIKIKENLAMEKEMESKDKLRMSIAEKIVDESKIDVPDLLIDAELERMKYKMESDLVASGMTLDEYFKVIGKTIDDIKVEWRPSAEKRVKLELCLAEISKKENIVPEKEKVEEEVTKLKSMYKDIDDLRAKIYLEGQMRNDMTFAFLEQQ